MNDEDRKCPNCEDIHEPCEICGGPTRCPPDETGQPFVHCDKCDLELRGDEPRQDDAAPEPRKES